MIWRGWWYDENEDENEYEDDDDDEEEEEEDEDEDEDDDEDDEDDDDDDDDDDDYDDVWCMMIHIGNQWHFKENPLLMNHEGPNCSTVVCHARLEEGRRGHLRQLENGMPFGGWSKHNFCDCFAAKRHEVRAWQVRF